MAGVPSLKLTDKEIAAMFAEPQWAEAYPPILSVQQAADLAQVPKATLYDWSSRGLLDECAFKAGRYLRIVRDKFIKKLISGL